MKLAKFHHPYSCSHSWGRPQGKHAQFPSPNGRKKCVNFLDKEEMSSREDPLREPDGQATGGGEVEERWRRVIWALHPPCGQSWSASWKHQKSGRAPGIGKTHYWSHLLTMRCGWNGGPTSWIHPTGGRSWSPYLMWVILKG